MTLKFSLGERVCVKKFHPSYDMHAYSELVGTIIRIDIYYEVQFNTCVGGNIDTALFQENELYKEEPTDIMEFLKHRLFDNN